MSIESPIFPEIRENEDFQVYRNLLARVSEETNITGFIKGGYTRDILYGQLSGSNRLPKDIDVALVSGTNLFVERLVAHGAQIELRRPRKKTPVFEMAYVANARKIIADIGILIADADVYHRDVGQEDLILQDIIHSDFTINSIYLPISSAFSRDALIDPTGGVRDLQDRKIRMTSPFILQNSPVCTLRAIYLADKLGFEIEEATKEEIVANGPNLFKSYRPLVIHYLDALLESPNNADNAKSLVEFGINEHLPEDYQRRVSQLV